MLRSKLVQLSYAEDSHLIGCSHNGERLSSWFPSDKRSFSRTRNCGTDGSTWRKTAQQELLHFIPVALQVPRALRIPFLTITRDLKLERDNLAGRTQGYYFY